MFIRKTVTICWWWIQGGGKGAEGRDAAGSVCGTRGGAARGRWGFPTARGWEKGWPSAASCMAAALGEEVSAWGGFFLSPSVPRQSWEGHSIHSQLRSCALGLTLVWLLQRIHTLMSGEKKSFRCLGKPGAAESSTVCEGELGLQLNDWKQAAVLC